MAAILDFTRKSNLSEKRKKFQIMFARVVNYDAIKLLLLMVKNTHFYSKLAGLHATYDVISRCYSNQPSRKNVSQG